MAPPPTAARSANSDKGGERQHAQPADKEREDRDQLRSEGDVASIAPASYAYSRRNLFAETPMASLDYDPLGRLDYLSNKTMTDAALPLDDYGVQLIAKRTPVAFPPRYSNGAAPN